MAVVICLCGISIFGTAFGMHLYHKDSSRPLPKVVRYIIFKHIAKLLCYDIGDNMLEASDETSTQTDKDSDVQEITVEDLRESGREINKSDLVDILMPALLEIQSDVLKLSRKLHGEEKCQQINNEWKMAANILDRLLMVIFFIINVFVSICLCSPMNQYL